MLEHTVEGDKASINSGNYTIKAITCDRMTKTHFTTAILVGFLYSLLHIYILQIMPKWIYICDEVVQQPLVSERRRKKEKAGDWGEEGEQLGKTWKYIQIF